MAVLNVGRCRGVRWARGTALLVALAVVGCGSATGPVAPCGGGRGGSGTGCVGQYWSQQQAPKYNPAAAPLYFSFDSASKTVKFTLVAGYNSSNNGMNFDGFSEGVLVIDIPTGWTANVTCRNKASSNQSCALVDGPGATQPSIPGAGTPKPQSGLPAGQSAAFSFTAPSPGEYRLSCLVPGHEDAGMWVTLVVISSGSPSASAF